MPSESDIESKFCEYAQTRGCLPIKFVDPSRKGAPDRIVLCPFGRVIFFEFKAPGAVEKKAHARHQMNYANILRTLGHVVEYCCGYHDACDCLDEFFDADF